MEQNKTSKYFKYAVGEILLVVIGILIALSINNWNENRKDRIKEIAILKELHKDFSENLKQFKSDKAVHFKSLQSTIQFKKYINHKDLVAVKDSIAKYYFSSFNSVRFSPSNGVVESLISSGEYQLIKNDSLRKYIISWQDILENYLESERLLGDLWKNKIEPYLIDQGDLANLGSSKNFNLITTDKFKNLTERQLLYLNNIVNIIKTGPLEGYLEEITRLSKVE